MSWDLRLGDCLDPVSGLASLVDKSVDHVICDPPYEAEAHTLQRRVKRGTGKVVNEPLSFEAITEDIRQKVAVEIVRICRGWLIVFCQAEAIFHWRKALEDAGAKWRRPMVWIKPDGQPCLLGDRPGMGYESIAAAWAGDGRSQWNGGGKVGVYRYVKSNCNGNDHPTQKPDPLMEALVRDFTNEGDKICDPFAGSGSTLVAATRLGRHSIGWERDPVFHETALRRIQNTREQLTIPMASSKPMKNGELFK